MQRRRAITLTLAGLSGMSPSLLAGCARPPECTARMSDQECGEAVARAAQEWLRKAAEAEYERQKQEALKRGEEFVADGQRRAGEAVADGQSRLKQWWDDLWKPAPKPETPNKPQAPVIVSKNPAVSFSIVSQPVPFDNVRWFNWYGATQYAYNDHLKDADNQEYEKLQGLHSGLDFGVAVGTDIFNCANQTGTVIAVSNPTNALNWGAGPENVVVLYADRLMVYGHVSKDDRPTVNMKIPPGARVARSGVNEVGVAHLHMEVLVFDKDWKPPIDGQPITSKPGNTRTNPMPYFSEELRKLIDAPSFPKSGMHFPDSDPRSDPYVQPDITPLGPNYWQAV